MIPEHRHLNPRGLMGKYNVQHPLHLLLLEQLQEQPLSRQQHYYQ
jgi:hypothetical protein